MTLPRHFFGVVHPDDSQDQQEEQDSVSMVLDRIVWHCGSKSYCWPRNETMAEDLGISERTVRYALAALRDSGTIAITDPNSRRRRIHLLDNPATRQEHGNVTRQQHGNGTRQEHGRNPATTRQRNPAIAGSI